MRASRYVCGRWHQWVCRAFGALEGLRDELEASWRAGENQRVRFGVPQVTLTVEAVARREAQGGGKIRWWLVEAGGEAKRASETTQTLVLTLSPTFRDEDGRT